MKHHDMIRNHNDPIMFSFFRLIKSLSAEPPLSMIGATVIPMVFFINETNFMSNSFHEEFLFSFNLYEYKLNIKCVYII